MINMLNTKITDLLGIRYPILQGAMLWLSKAELVAAVSNAGGLGILSSLSYLTGDEFREGVKKTKSLTDNPFAVNVVFMPMDREISNDDILKIIIEEGVEVVDTVGAVPSAVIETLHQHGIICLHKATSTRHAIAAEKRGVDAVCVEGFECAGHPGMDDISSLILIQDVLDKVNIPVIAAGGFGDGKGLVAALAMGAEGVLMGTRFLVTKECPVHPNVKDWCLNAEVTDTILGLQSLRDPVRYMKTETAERVLEMEARGADLNELMPIISGFKNKEVIETGDLNAGIFSCGQYVGLVHDIPSVKELIDRIVTEADETLIRLERFKNK